MQMFNCLNKQLFIFYQIFARMKITHILLQIYHTFLSQT